MAPPQRSLLLFAPSLLLVFATWIQASHALPASSNSAASSIATSAASSPASSVPSSAAASASTGSGVKPSGPSSTSADTNTKSQQTGTGAAPSPAPAQTPIIIIADRHATYTCVDTDGVGMPLTRKDSRCHVLAASLAFESTRTISEYVNPPRHTARFQYLPDYITPTSQLDPRDVSEEEGEEEGDGDGDDSGDGAGKEEKEGEEKEVEAVEIEVEEGVEVEVEMEVEEANTLLNPEQLQTKTDDIPTTTTTPPPSTTLQRRTTTHNLDPATLLRIPKPKRLHDTVIGTRDASHRPRPIPHRQQQARPHPMSSTTATPGRPILP